jgi:integrase
MNCSIFTPPAGVRLNTDALRRGSRIRARVRWTDPTSHARRSRSITVADDAAAQEFFELLRASSSRGLDPLVTLRDYANSIRDRYLRGVDLTSTAAGYRAGLRLRLLPALGHLRVREITAGIIDRTIDEWETQLSQSTLKNTIAALTRVLDEAVRDEIIERNPSRNRAHRHYRSSTSELRPPLQLPSLDDVLHIAQACGEIHQCYADHVMLSAFLAARGAEISGLRVGDVTWASKTVLIERQTYPGTGGIITKPTKNRRPRRVPIVNMIERTLLRLTVQRPATDRLLHGPRGGIITTASLRRATHWDALIAALGWQGLRRHDLRHVGATWFANSGVPIHVVADILGHGSIETTRLYLHTDNTALARAAISFNRHLTKESKTSELGRALSS